MDQPRAGHEVSGAVTRESVPCRLSGVLCVTTLPLYTSNWFFPAEPAGTRRRPRTPSTSAVVTEEAHTRVRSCCAVCNVADFRSSKASIPGCRVGVCRRERHRAKCQPYSSWSVRAGSRNRRSRGPSVLPGPLSVAACARVCTPSHRRSRTRRFERSRVCASPQGRRSPRTFRVKATTSRNTRSFSSVVDV